MEQQKKPRTRLKKVMNRENYNLNKISAYKKPELYDMVREERAVNIHFKGLMEKDHKSSDYAIQQAQTKLRSQDGKHRIWQALAIVSIAVTVATLFFHK